MAWPPNAKRHNEANIANIACWLGFACAASAQLSVVARLGVSSGMICVLVASCCMTARWRCSVCKVFHERIYVAPSLGGFSLSLSFFESYCTSPHSSLWWRSLCLFIMVLVPVVVCEFRACRGGQRLACGARSGKVSLTHRSGRKKCAHRCGQVACAVLSIACMLRHDRRARPPTHIS